MRVAADEWNRLELRVHALLAGVPLHDVWAVDLPGGRHGLVLADLRAVLAERVALSSAAMSQTGTVSRTAVCGKLTRRDSTRGSRRTRGRS